MAVTKECNTQRTYRCNGAKQKPFWQWLPHASAFWLTVARSTYEDTRDRKAHAPSFFLGFVWFSHVTSEQKLSWFFGLPPLASGSSGLPIWLYGAGLKDIDEVQAKIEKGRVVYIN